MKATRIKAIAIALVLLCSTALGHWARPTRHLSDQVAKLDIESVFPKQFGEWRIDTNQPATIISPDVQQQLDQIYGQVLSRTYVNSQGYRIMLSVAYGGDQSSATRAHRPDVCYPAQGFQVESSNDASIEITGRALPVRQMVAKLGARNEPVTYWLTVGDVAVVSGRAQARAQWRYTLQGLIADGMLVRVSSIDSDSARAFGIQDQFVQQMLGAFDSMWIPRVFGSAIGGQ
ncbi:exosortase-associated protein EpsI, B-type [Burkholderiaceae bacterium UC74_6]